MTTQTVAAEPFNSSIAKPPSQVLSGFSEGRDRDLSVINTLKYPPSEPAIGPRANEILDNVLKDGL